MQFRARFLANVIQFAAQQGASPKQLLALTGKNRAQLNDELLYFEADIYNKVVEEALRQTTDPFLGLHLGQYMSLSAAGLIVQIVQSSNTIAEGLEHIIAFANLGCQALPFTLKKGKEEWILEMTPNALWCKQSEQVVRHTIAGTVIFTIREIQSLSHQKYYPLRVHFGYEKPQKFLAYEEAFRCPVSFGGESTPIVLNAKHVQEAVITSDYKLLKVLVKFAEAKLESLQKQKGFGQTVKNTIINLIQPQFPSIKQVALNLNMSVRSLQRKLKQDALTYKDIMDELKQQFACDYLKNKHLIIKEIAFLLDYSDASSFTRSFKRWTGTKPEKYRLQVQNS